MTVGQEEIVALANQVFDQYATAHHESDDGIYRQRTRDAAIFAATVLADHRGLKKWSPLYDDELLKRGVQEGLLAHRERRIQTAMAEIAMYNTGFITKGSSSHEEALARLLVSNYE